MYANSTNMPANGATRASTFGRVGTSFPRRATTSTSSDVTSVIKKKPTKLPTLPTSLTVATNA